LEISYQSRFATIDGIIVRSLIASRLTLDDVELGYVGHVDAYLFSRPVEETTRSPDERSTTLSLHIARSFPDERYGCIRVQIVWYMLAFE